MSTPEETEIAMAMDPSLHRDRRAFDIYTEASDDDTVELRFTGRYGTRYYTDDGEEGGWTTVGEAAAEMERDLFDCLTRDAILTPAESGKRTVASEVYEQDVKPAPVAKVRSQPKSKRLLKSPLSSPEKPKGTTSLSKATVETLPKKSPKKSPKKDSMMKSPKKVLPEILESSVQQYRPVYQTPIAAHTNLVPRPYKSRYSSNTSNSSNSNNSNSSAQPYKLSMASSHEILPRTELTSTHGDDKALVVRESKDTKGRVKKSKKSEEEDLEEAAGRRDSIPSETQYREIRNKSPDIRASISSPDIRASNTSPDIRTSNTSPDIEMGSKSPDDFAVRMKSPDVAMRSKNLDTEYRSRIPCFENRRSSSPCEYQSSPSRRSLKPQAPSSSPTRNVDYTSPQPSSPRPPPPEDYGLNAEESLALNFLEAAVMEEEPIASSLYSCSNTPFNSHRELISMIDSEPSNEMSHVRDYAHEMTQSAETLTSSSVTQVYEEYKLRPSAEEEQVTDTRSCSDSYTSETTFSHDSLNAYDDMRSLRSFVAQKNLEAGSIPQLDLEKRKESIDFTFKDVEDSPVFKKREATQISSVSPSSETQEKSMLSQVSPKIGKFTQKVSDRSKENDAKSMISAFNPCNILSFDTKIKAKNKPMTSETETETDTPTNEGRSSDAIEEYILKNTREEAMKLGLVGNEDIATHEAKKKGGSDFFGVPDTRQIPEVTISNELQSVCPSVSCNKQRAPTPTSRKCPAWKPQDIENYLLENNMDENLRLGLLSQEDFEIYEWKRTTGLSPICDTSWTRETLRKNKIVRSSSSSGSFPTSPEPPSASSPSEPPSSSSRTLPLSPSSIGPHTTEATLKVTSESVEGRPIPPTRRRGKAPAPPVSVSGSPSRASCRPRAPVTPPPLIAPSAARKETGHFAFMGFKLGQRVTKGVGDGITRLGQAVSKGKGGGGGGGGGGAGRGGPGGGGGGGGGERGRQEDLNLPTAPHQEAPAAASEVSRLEFKRPDVARGSRVGARLEVTTTRPERVKASKLCLDKIGIRLPGLATGRNSGPSITAPPPPAPTRCPAVAKVLSGGSSCPSSPCGTPDTNQSDMGRQQKPAQEKRLTPYRRLVKLLGRDSTPATHTVEAPAHALFLREKPRVTGSSDQDVDDGGIKKKLSDMRLRLGWLRRRGESQGSVRPLPEEVQCWAESFHNLMASKYGQALFKAFLQREFSEENVEFWLAVEDFKKTRAAKMPSKASKIHSDYVAVQAPKEINLDPSTREKIAKSLDCPDKFIFDGAQKRVQALMESDAYLRFLQSELYKELLHPETSPSYPDSS